MGVDHAGGHLYKVMCSNTASTMKVHSGLAILLSPIARPN